MIIMSLFVHFVRLRLVLKELCSKGLLLLIFGMNMLIQVSVSLDKIKNINKMRKLFWEELMERQRIVKCKAVAQNLQKWNTLNAINVKWKFVYNIDLKTFMIVNQSKIVSNIKKLKKTLVFLIGKKMLKKINLKKNLLVKKWNVFFCAVLMFQRHNKINRNNHKELHSKYKILKALNVQYAEEYAKTNKC